MIDLNSSTSLLNEEINIRNSNNNKLPKNLLKSSNNIFIIKSDDLLNNNSNNNNSQENDNYNNNIKITNSNNNEKLDRSLFVSNKNCEDYSVNTILVNDDSYNNSLNNSNNNIILNGNEIQNENNENNDNLFLLNKKHQFYSNNNNNTEIEEIDNNNNNNNNNNNINFLKDSNNIEMDYIDLNNSNNILKRSLNFINNNSNSNINNSNNILNKISRILSFQSLKTAILIIMISNLGYSTYFSYTSAEALSHTFYKTFSITSKEFGSLFTLYAIPNVIMVFLSGVIIDIIGPNIVSIVLSAIVVVSTFIGALSPPNYSLMLFSRFLLGFAGESLIACSNTMMSQWFSPNKTLPLSMGVLIGWIYSANFISLSILPIINKHLGFKWSLWILFFISSFGIFLNLLYLLIKNKFNDIKIYQFNNNNENNQNNEIKQHQDEEVKPIVVINNEDDEADNGADIIIGYGDDKIKLMILNIYFKIKSILIQIPIRMWIMVAIVFLGYSALFGFAIIGPDFLNQKYGFSESEAALILSSEHIVSALFSPIVGILIKKLGGKRIIVLLVSLVILSIGLTCLLVTSATTYPLVWIVICGIGYSMLNTTILSSIPIVVPIPTIIATCYGFVGTSYNCGLIVFPYILGSLKESRRNYNYSIIVLIGNCLISILLVGLLKFYDLKELSLNKRLD